MTDESVVFEIQVDKKLLEEILTNNENFKDSYEKILKLEDIAKHLKEEVNSLRAQLRVRDQTNKNLVEENLQLKGEVKILERYRKVFEENEIANELEATENKMLKMKMNKVEKEKSNLVADFEKERRILEELLHDNYQLKRTEDAVQDVTAKLLQVTEELDKTKKMLSQARAEAQSLDEDKLDLETELAQMARKMRLLEERTKSIDLEHVESKLLKLKLQTVENEKKYLLDDFERERTIITNQNKPRVARIEENVKLLRKWIEKEMRERMPRESEEVKVLKAKIASMENDTKNLVEGFELERKVFSKVLKEHGINNAIS